MTTNKDDIKKEEKIDEKEHPQTSASMDLTRTGKPLKFGKIKRKS